MDHPGPSSCGNNPQQPAGNHHQSLSLFVTGLHAETDEIALFEKFTPAGPVDSVRIVREMITFRPLGSAYVNFQRPQDAERAFQTMTGELMQGRPIQLAWSEVDTCTPHELAGIFVRNIDETMDNQTVCDMFSTVGNVLSCRVALDIQGNTKGYAFVYFYAASSVGSAIEKVDGLTVNGLKWSVAALFTKIHVRNFGDRLTQAGLRELFAPYGNIVASGVMIKDFKNRGCGYVAYDNPEAAGHSMEALNGKELSDGKILRVVPAHKRDVEALPSHVGAENVQIFVRNLDDSVDNRQLGEIFAPFGEVKSRFVVKDKGKSKGFGFVTYASGDQAARAVREMDQREVAGKRIFVKLSRGKQAKASSAAAVDSDHEPLNDTLLMVTKDQNELKHLLGRRLYQLVKEVNHKFAGRITFQLMEQHTTDELTALLKDPKRVQIWVEETAKIVHQSNLWPQWQLVIVPAQAAAA